MSIIDKIQGDLPQQYIAFRTAMWADLILGCLCAALGEFAWAFGLVIVGLILGQVSNSKLLLMKNINIENKLDKLLEGK